MQRQIPGKYWFFGLLLVWLIINLIQASTIGLDPDEAYYWMYSQDLDWGYFDHPPMVALLIRAGTELLPGTIGLRLGTILAQALSFVFIWLVAGSPSGKKENLTLIGLLTAMPMLQVYGFVATPDGPLLLFTAVYLYLYKRFVNDMNLLNTVMLGFCMAALLYSKYHGVLLIGFIALSNLSLLKKYQFYLASLIGFIIFLPHLFWQYENGFPSFLYHLQGRDDIYEVKYTLTYLVNQLVIFSPLLFPVLVYVLVKRKAQSFMGRAYRFLLIGFWAFFLYTSFKGHVEPQWTAILSFPIVLILYRATSVNDRISKIISRLVLITVIILMMLRLELSLQVTIVKNPFEKRPWISELADMAGDLPVIFHNTYRDISRYSFYTGKKAYVFSDVDYRPNQFDIWDREIELQGKRVLLVTTDSCPTCDSIAFSDKTFLVQTLDSLQAFRNVKITLSELPRKELHPGDTIHQTWQIYNPYPYNIHLKHGTLPIRAGVVFLRKNDRAGIAPVQLFGNELLPSEQIITIDAHFIIPDLPPDHYSLGAGFNYQGFAPDLKSQTRRIEITAN